MIASVVAVALVAGLVGFWLGRRSAAEDGTDFAALWLYQQALNDCGHEIDTLLGTGDEALSDTSRDALVAARELAYPQAIALRPEARDLVVRATVPSLVDSGFDLVDLAHAYLALSERLAEEIVRAQFSSTRRWVPLRRAVGASRARAA